MPTKEELEKQVAELESGSKSDPKNKKKTLIKYIINILVVLIATSVAIILTLTGKVGDKPKFQVIFENLKLCDWRWLLIVFAALLVAILLRSLVLFCFARLYTRKYHFHQAVAVDQVGVFYNAVTPTSSGGQVMEAYTFKKQGIPISNAVSMLAMYSIMFQIVLILYGVISFIAKYDLINSIGWIPFKLVIGGKQLLSFELPIWPLTIIGFLLNVGVIGLVLLMGYWKGFHNFVMGPCISFLAKIRLIKNADKKREDLRVQVENFKIEMRRLFSNIPFTILIFVLFVIYFTVRFSYPFFISKALGNQSNVATFWDAIFLGNYHQMVTGLIPLPGSAGVSELFFEKLFAPTVVRSFSVGDDKASFEVLAQNSFFFAFSDDIKNEVIVKMAAQGIFDPTYDEIVNFVFTNNIAREELIKITQASKAMAGTALLLWRSITFILPIAVAGIVTAFYRVSPKQTPHEDALSRATFVSLQSMTQDEREADMRKMVETAILNREDIFKRIKGVRKEKKKKEIKGFDDIDITNDDGE